MTGETPARVVAVNRGTERADRHGSGRGPRHDALEAWVGRWINVGHIINDDGSTGPAITTSDVYEWAPGGLFLAHSAYGRIGEFDVGGMEIIGYDEASGDYRSHFFDSQGNVTVSSLVARGDTWTYRATARVPRWSSATTTGSRPSCTSAPTTARPTDRR